MVCCVAAHLAWLGLRCGGGGDWMALARSSPECVAAALTAALHAGSLFGVTWIMGEGRVSCFAVGVLIAVWSVAAVERVRRKAHSSALYGPAVPSLLPLLLSALVSGLCWLALLRLGLIDRYGHDPHDKSQPKALTNLLLTSAASPDGRPTAGRGGQWAAIAGALASHGHVLLPLMATPPMLAGCHYLLARSHIRPEAETIVGNSPGGLLTGLPWACLAAACVMQHLSAAAWWAAQALGLAHHSAASLAAALCRTTAEAAPRCGATGLGDGRWVRAAMAVQLPFLQPSASSSLGGLANAANSLMQPALQLPLRLLLPRFVPQLSFLPRSILIIPDLCFL